MTPRTTFVPGVPPPWETPLQATPAAPIPRKTRLSRAQVREIRVKRGAGASFKSLSRCYGAGYDTLMRAVLGTGAYKDFV
jgi:hypothetical protein